MTPRALFASVFLVAVGCSSGSSDTPAEIVDVGESGPSDGSSVADSTTPTTDSSMPPTDSGTAVTPCWPFERPPVTELRASKKKVFAHYFSPYPLSLDNKPSESDYYAVHYLRPEGESGKFSYCGGFLRERPLPVAPAMSGVEYQGRNFEIEIRRAIAVGIDGFAYDMLSTSGTHWTRLTQILDAAKRVDGGFHIVLMPDMTSTFQGSDADARTAFVNAIKAVAGHSATYHLDDGRLVLAPFAADRRNVAWWSSVVAELKTAKIEVALVPVYVAPWEAATNTLSATVPLYGTSTWGPRTVSGATSLTSAVGKAHDKGLLWMAPVAPQDSRPKDLVYTEANNSRAFRALWETAISSGADWIQLITWNDYSEDTEISPSSRINGAFYDLTAYYATWFKTGSRPAIVRDALYYFHRTHSMSAAPDLTKQRSAFAVVNGAPPSDEIELLAFLTSPGKLQITIGGTTKEQDVEAGIQSFRVPLAEGTPSFKLVRGGATVVSLTSASPISNTIVYQDPLYHAGGSMSCVSPAP